MPCARPALTRARHSLDDAESKLKETERDFNKSRTEAQKARDDFNRIKKKRCDLFNAAFTHISERIDKVYKELTKGKASPMGGVAYLSLEDTEEPYLSGARYHIMPPMKRFRDMTDLSGGEKTMGALALLFAISSFKPAPFFFLDEVDAALCVPLPLLFPCLPSSRPRSPHSDSQNVAKVANYIRAHASERMQFIVISLKASLYERAQALAGVYRDQAVGASATLTLELERYA
jgi:structural maintenance of chromosome 1